ncbi:MAG: hypothetical protein EA406_00980 [Rhodospirillales bacterium]|nr:MAG: hypothetical protein EA406_00980 [Rhodospirillales bacterium]
MMSRIKRFARPVPTLTAAALAAALLPGSVAQAAEQVSFALDVRPILESRCVSCHQPGSAGYEESGLDLTSYEGLMAGTRHGPIVVPGDPVTSNLNVLIEGRAAPELLMPHDERPLLRHQQLIIRDWVRQGARPN